MIFNMIGIGNGGGSGVEWHHGSWNKQSGSATFAFSNLDGKPKLFIIRKINTSNTNGFISYAILNSDGTYTGMSVTGDTSWGTRKRNSDANWDEATHTFSIVLWNSYGTYEYDYLI